MSLDGKTIAVVEDGENRRLALNTDPWALHLPGDGDVFDDSDRDPVDDTTSPDDDYVLRPPKPVEAWSPIE